MYSLISNVKKACPVCIWNSIKFFLSPIWYKIVIPISEIYFKWRVVFYLEEHKIENIEYAEILSYINSNRINFLNVDMISYMYKRKYQDVHIDVYYDVDYTPYVYINGFKMFLRRDFSKKRCVEYVRNLLIEQDMLSPHRYMLPNENSIVADCGAAEGIFVILNWKYIRFAYLFEGDAQWLSVLQKTFKDKLDKIKIVPYFISNKNEDGYITLDEYFSNKNVTYVKADVEGNEKLLIEGGKDVLLNKVSQAAICAYHKYDDEKYISNFYQKAKYDGDFSHSRGYIIANRPWYTGDCYEPYVRRGVMYISKRCAIESKK